MWNAFKPNKSLTLEEALEIIDDGLVHGFEFKVENGCIYYREICDSCS